MTFHGITELAGRPFLKDRKSWKRPDVAENSSGSSSFEILGGDPCCWCWWMLLGRLRECRAIGILSSSRGCRHHDARTSPRGLDKGWRMQLGPVIEVAHVAHLCGVELKPCPFGLVHHPDQWHVAQRTTLANRTLPSAPNVDVPAGKLYFLDALWRIERRIRVVAVAFIAFVDLLREDRCLISNRFEAYRWIL